MKKLLHSVVFIVLLIFGAFLYLFYPEEVYKNVFSDKYPITISAKEGQSKEEFLDFLDDASNLTNTPLFLASVTNSVSLSCDFHIYTTSINKDFIGVPHNYPGNKLSSGDCISTDGKEQYNAYAGNLDYEFYFYPLCDANIADTECSIFYVAKNNDLFLQLIENHGYIFEIEPMDDTPVFDSKLIAFAFMLVFIYIISLYYAYSRNREIVILKINGYKATDIFASVFFKGLIYIWISAAVVLAMIFVSYALPFGFSALCFSKWIFPLYATYTLAISIVYTVACFLYVLKTSIKEMRAVKPKKWLHIITLIVRFGFIITVIWGLSNSFASISHYLKFNKCWENMSVYQHLSSVIVNSKSSNISEDYEEKSYDFIKTVMGEFPTYIINPETLESDNEIYVTESYFDLFNCIDSNGEHITSEYITNNSDERLTILVPEYITDIPSEYRAIKYKAEQKFPLINCSYMQNEGFACDPIIYIYNDELLFIDALTIVCNQYILINSGDVDILEALKPQIEQIEITDILHEVTTVKELFSEDLYNASTFIVYYSILGVLYLIILIMLTVFETVVYFQNHSRELCVKYLHGYGEQACLGIWIIKAVTYLLIFVISWLTGMLMTFALFAAVLDILLFMICMDRLKIKGMITHLKGET